VARTAAGRHRAPGFNPVNELALIASRSAQPALKASAVAVASGGLVASFAIPASAATLTGDGTPVHDPAGTSEAFAVVAPSADLASSPDIFGVSGFTAPPVADVPAAPVTDVPAGPAPAEGAPAVVPVVPVVPAAPAAAPPAPTVVPAPRVVNAAPAPVRAPAAALVQAPAADPAPAPPAPAPVRVVAPAVAPAPVRVVAPAAAPAPVRVEAPAAAPAPLRAPAPAPAPPASTGGIIGIAAGLTGIPYRYGGTTPSGFDCSGFTGYVYARAGISIPRTAEAQRQASTKVTNPVPGDLIFVGYPATHVGIYAGGGKLYDSQRTGTFSGLHVIWTSKNVSYGRF